MGMLSDGTVVPSYLGYQERTNLEDSGIQTNGTLRYGEVKQLYYPDDPQNQSKRWIEYAVDVTSKDGIGPRTTIRYFATTLSNPFGGGTDCLRYVFRAGTPDASITSAGSKVLILCLDGDQPRGIIIGGVRDSYWPANSPNGIDLDEGINLLFQYNGLRAHIEEDGSLTVIYTGPRLIDGSLSATTPEENTGSGFQFDNNGSIQLYGPANENQQAIFIDNDQKTFSITADTEFNATGAGTMTFKMQDDIMVSSITGAATVSAADNIILLSAGVLTGNATDFTMLGSTFRTAQKKMNRAVSSAATQANSALQQASQYLSATSSGLTSPSAAAAMGNAAAAIAQAAVAISAIASAINSFESNASKYLSKVNKSD